MESLSAAEIGSLYKDIGRNIKRVRTSPISPVRTQEELGDLVGLTRTSITNIEKGRQRIMVHTLLSICNVLDVKVSEVLPTKVKREEIKFSESVSPSEETAIKRMVKDTAPETSRDR